MLEPEVLYIPTVLCESFFCVCSSLQVIWWFILVVMVVYVLLYCFHTIRTQRGYVDTPQEVG